MQLNERRKHFVELHQNAVTFALHRCVSITQSQLCNSLFLSDIFGSKSPQKRVIVHDIHIDEPLTFEADSNARSGKLLRKFITLAVFDPCTGHHPPPRPSW